MRRCVHVEREVRDMTAGLDKKFNPPELEIDCPSFLG